MNTETDLEKKEKEIKLKFLYGYRDGMNEVKRLKSEIISLEMDKQEFIESAQSPLTQNLSGMPGAHNNRDLSDYEVTREKYETMINEMKEEREGLKTEVLNECKRIMQAIDKMEDSLHRQILSYYFISRYPKWKVGKEVHLERTQLWSHYNKAIEEFEIPKCEHQRTLNGGKVVA